MNVGMDLTLDCADARLLATFWRTALGYVDEPPPAPYATRAEWLAQFDLPEDDTADGGAWLCDPEGVRPRLCILKVPEPKTAKNRLHLDLRVPGHGSPDERWARIRAEAERLVRAGGNESLVLPVAKLQEHGVRVGLGSDGVRDAWSPFGNADMLHRAHILGWVTDVRLDGELSECYEVAAHGGSDVMHLDRADFRPGAPADFVLVRAECLPQVVVDMPQRDLVVHGGRVVARDGELV